MKTKNTTRKPMKATPAKQRKGFNVMNAKQRTAIASMGGAATSAKYGSSHMARLGAIGGRNSHRNTNSKK